VDPKTINLLEQFFSCRTLINPTLINPTLINSYMQKRKKKINNGVCQRIQVEDNSDV